MALNLTNFYMHNNEEREAECLRKFDLKLNRLIFKNINSRLKLLEKKKLQRRVNLIILLDDKVLLRI